MLTFLAGKLNALISISLHGSFAGAGTRRAATCLHTQGPKAEKDIYFQYPLPDVIYKNKSVGKRVQNLKTFFHSAEETSPFY